MTYDKNPQATELDRKTVADALTENLTIKKNQYAQSTFKAYYRKTKQLQTLIGKELLVTVTTTKYMDFELKDRLFWKRFLTMTAHNNVTDQTIERNFFRCGDFQTTDVLDPVEAKKMISIVNEIQPDLIIWDVLARMHTAAENDNGLMGQVMRSISASVKPRASSRWRKVAHLVLLPMRPT